MCAQRQTPEDLLRAVDAHHENYLQSLRALHDALAATASSAGAAGASSQTPGRDSGAASPVMTAARPANGEPSYAVASSPILRPLGSSPAVPSDPAFPPIGGPLRRRGITISSPPERRPTDGLERRSFTGLSNDGGTRAHVPASINETEYGSDDDGGIGAAGGWMSLTEKPRTASASTVVPAPPVIFQPIKGYLETEEFSDEALVNHIRTVQFQEATAKALEPCIKDWADLPSPAADPHHPSAAASAEATLASLAASEADGLFGSATFQVYGVGADSEARPRHEGDGDALVDARLAWATLRHVNPDGRSVGRITVLQEPSPVMLASLHLTLRDRFDVDEVFRHLITDVGNKGKTRSLLLNRAFEPSPTRQRSFLFVFKYYTVVGQDLAGYDLKPAPWQQYDSRPADRRSADHIDIAECSSVLALSLCGEPAGGVRNRSRRGMVGGKIREGPIFDTFAPWQLLVVQSFPDYEHTPRNEESGRRTFCNGPYAFLDRLVDEYRDATKRNEILNDRIAALITPPTAFMFDVKLRDKLLFEDANFTYSRRYFWAFNTLGVVNDGIKSMIAAYRDTFTLQFWEGRHQHLWPHPAPDSESGRRYRDEMSVLRVELERAIEDLRGVLEKNERTRKEIVSLRDQLFSGSSIREGRRVIDQGDNIKILTSISMIFLPLTFVTSVFGITALDLRPDEWQFPVTMVLVCVPFILLVLMVQTHRGMKLVKDGAASVERFGRRVLDRGKDAMAHHATADASGGGGGGGGGGGTSNAAAGTTEAVVAPRGRIRRPTFAVPLHVRGGKLSVSSRAAAAGAGPQTAGGEADHPPAAVTAAKGEERSARDGEERFSTFAGIDVVEGKEGSSGGSDGGLGVMEREVAPMPLWKRWRREARRSDHVMEKV